MFLGVNFDSFGELESGPIIENKGFFAEGAGPCQLQGEA
jgi:hypothetical protein